MEQDLRMARDENDKLKGTLEEARNEQIKSEQKRNQMEVEVLDLKRSNQALREDKSRLDTELSDCRRMLDEEREKSR
jgi:hypothetical protein